MQKLLNGIKDKRILVIGDIMLDNDVYLTDENRTDYDGKAPVYKVERSEFKLGGAGNVAANVAALGGDAYLVGLNGRGFSNRTELGNCLIKHQIQNGFAWDNDRPVTLKTRYWLNDNLIHRVDDESDMVCKASTTQDLIDSVNNLSSCHSGYKEIRLSDFYDAIIFADYDKGCISPPLIQYIVKEVKGKIPIIADPKIRNFWDYRGIMAMAPNKDEYVNACHSLGLDLEPRPLLERLYLNHLVVTEGGGGCIIVNSYDSDVSHLQGYEIDSFVDSCGAGDTFTAAWTLALTVNNDIIKSANFANLVASLSCKNRGAYAVKRDEVLEII